MPAGTSRAASSSRPGQRDREVQRVLQQTSALTESPRIVFDPAIWHRNPNTGSYVDITTGEIRPESDFQFTSGETSALETRPAVPFDNEDEAEADRELPISMPLPGIRPATDPEGKPLRCPECHQTLLDVPREGKIWRVCRGMLSAEPTCDYYGL